MADEAANENNGTNASRRLFQDDNNENPETEENRINVCSELLRSHTAEARERWNFDFENETPLEGDWEWEKTEVEDREDVNSEQENLTDHHTENNQTEERQQ